MQGAQGGEPTVGGDEEVETFGFSNLAHNDPGRAHAERFLHQFAQGHLAGTLKRGLAALKRNPVAGGQG